MRLSPSPINSILFSLLFTAAIQAQIPSEPRQPNIILIVADDIGAECMNSYGGRSYSTPALDAMASGGLRFTRAYAMPSCTPSRTKLLTGRSNVRNYIYFTCMDSKETTIANLLSDAGYKTGATGKWQLLGSPLYPEFHGEGSHPTAAGFDEWCLWQVEEVGPRYWDPMIETDNAPPMVHSGLYGPDIFSDFALDFVSRHQSEPFFLYYPMVLGHNPFHNPPGYPSGGSNRQNFSYMMEYMDYLIGRLFNHVNQLGLLENTLVLFVSDNGTNSQIRSDYRGYIVPGFKGRTNECGLRTPMIAYWKNHTPVGKECSDLIDLTDFFPTLLEVADKEIPSNEIIDGVSFLPQILGLTGKPREWIFGYFNPKPSKDYTSSRRRWASNRRYRLYDDGRMYQIIRDPLETENIQNDPSPNIQDARVSLFNILANHPKNPPGIGG